MSDRRSRFLSDFCTVHGPRGEPVTVDLYTASRVLSLEWSQHGADDFPDLRMVLKLNERAEFETLTLHLTGVRRLTIAELAPHLFLPELELESVAGRGLEGIAFELVSHLDRRFRCEFHGLSATVG